jgi:hypothetical protein
MESHTAAPVATDREHIVIDSTGSVNTLSEVVRNLPSLGRLVLAAPPCAREITLATYRDIHVRSLALIGVPWAGGAPASDSSAGVSQKLIEAVFAEAVRAWPSEPGVERPLYVLPGENNL